MSHFAYELGDLNFKFDRTWLNRHENTTLILSLFVEMIYHILHEYLSRSVICSLVMLLTWCNANARLENKHGCILYDKHMHYKNLNLSCQVWTLGKLLHDEPILHAMSETKTTGSCKTHVHHYLDKVKQAPSTCTYEMHLYDKAIIWR